MNPKSIDNKTLFGETKKNLLEEITREDVIKGLAMPEKDIIIDDNIKLEIINCSENSDLPVAFNNKMLTVDLPLLYVKNNSNQKVADVFLCFGEKLNGERILFIANRLLKKQNEGLGLDLECKIESFCKEHKINSIYNKASSRDKKVGAYVWARYGYEFADESQIENLRMKFYYFAIKQGIVITTFLENLKRPIDFALAQGVPQNGGEKVNIGKMFLLNSNIEWHGKRDLTPGSQGTKDFIAYLKERGREDLIEKYYADEK